MIELRLMHLRDALFPRLAEAVGTVPSALYGLLAALPKPEPGEPDLGYRVEPDEGVIATMAEAGGHQLVATVTTDAMQPKTLEAIFIGTQSFDEEWWDAPAPIEGPYDIYVTPQGEGHRPTFAGDLVDAGEFGLFACTGKGWHRLSEPAATRCRAAWAARS